VFLYKTELIHLSTFRYEEFQSGLGEGIQSISPNSYCWMNAAYAFAANMTRAYAETNWVSAIQGAGHGGGVDNLPACPMANSDDDPVCARSTEVIISVRRELELCNLGFLPLCHVKDPGASVFISAQTCQRPKTCEAQEPTADAAIAARLPCVMTISRFAHYLKCVSRDKSVLFVSRQEFQNCLNSWISELVLGEPGVSEEMKIRYPLAEAKITVEPLPGSPGRFRAVAQLRPHLPLGKLTTSLKVLVDLPRR
jgi:type VI secretion system protein ImpC